MSTARRCCILHKECACDVGGGDVGDDNYDNHNDEDGDGDGDGDGGGGGDGDSDGDGDDETCKLTLHLSDVLKGAAFDRDCVSHVVNYMKV